MTRRSGLALVFVAWIASGCVASPPGPARPSSTPSRDDVVAREYRRLRTKALAKQEEQRSRVERVGRRLLEAIPDHPKVQFVIVTGDQQVNAGATFGQVAVTSGMLNFIRSDDEMAVVLGHELAHIEEGHVTKGMISGIALNVLAIVLESQVPGAGQAAGGVGQLFLNHYTQTQERDADRVGLGYAYQAGFDPEAAVDVMERMAVEVPQTMTAGYFDTHPSSVERAVAARERADELLAKGPPPGRERVVAAERAARDAEEARRDYEYVPKRRPGVAVREEARVPVEASVEEPPQPSAGDEACARAATYVEMGRDAHSRAEERALYERALRYCPSSREARAALDRLQDAGEDRGSKAGASGS